MQLKSFKTGFVKSGSKTVSESAPKLILTSTNSTFKLNNKACALLGVTPGESTIGMFDMYGTDVYTDEDHRYFIVGNIEDGSKLTKNRHFNYTTIYNTMLAGEGTEPNSVKSDDLVDKGLMVKREGKNTPLYISLSTITFDLEQFGDEEVELPDGTKGYVYRIFNPVVKAHTPRGDKSEDVTDAVIED